MLILRIGLDKGKIENKNNCLSLSNIGGFYIKKTYSLPSPHHGFCKLNPTHPGSHDAVLLK